MTLYHYCSAAAFESIIGHKSIRLSSLSSSNDTHEGVWVDSLLRKVCLENEFTPLETERVSGLFKDATDFWDVLGFCLTPNEDMLSQWRGYADDGCGFAIGFNEDALRQIDPDRGKLLEVIYDPVKQHQTVLARLQPDFEVLRQGIQSVFLDLAAKNLSSRERFASVFKGERLASGYFWMSLIDILYQLKNPAFREENETRLVAYTNRDYPACEFHRSGRKMVPYRTMEFSSVEPAISIDEIVIGPRNPTHSDVIRAFLNKHGFNGTDITLSTATYRASI